MAGISKKKVKTKGGKEVIKYVITYRDIFGKQHTSGYYDTLKEAKKDLPKFQDNIIQDKKVTVGYIIDEFITSRKQKQRAKNTIRNYENSKKKLTKYLEVDYHKITSLMWQQIIYKIRDEVSPHVARAVYSLLSGAFHFCLKYKIISQNPFEIVENVEEPESEHNHFDIDEQLRLLKLCKLNYPEFYMLLFTFLATGMREGEIFGLLKKNVDFENNRIYVCAQYTSKEFKPKTKTKKSKRYVYMFPTFAQELKDFINSDTTNSPLVFHNSKGKYLNSSNVRQRYWFKLLELAGYDKKHARLQDLRGTNADTALELGLSITFARDTLGHTTQETTLKHYAKTNRAMINEGLEKFESAFGSEKCEINVSQDNFEENNKIIQFSKFKRHKG